MALSEHAGADLTSDGSLDSYDLKEFADNWLECNLDPPELCLEKYLYPTTLLLVGLGAAMLRKKR